MGGANGAAAVFAAAMSDDSDCGGENGERAEAGEEGGANVECFARIRRFEGRCGMRQIVGKDDVSGERWGDNQ